MATSKEYLTFILDQLSDVNGITHRQMMGEYIIYMNGKIAKFLDDNATYLGNQLECEFGGNQCFGIVANMDFILICPTKQTAKIPNLSFIRKDKKCR